MAKKSMRYDHPAYQVRDSTQVVCAAGTASTVISKFIAFAAMKIKAVRGVPTTAGTNTAAGYDLLNGTTTVGGITFGTETAGTGVAGSITAANAVLAEGDVLDFKTKANSATLASQMVIEYELVPGADITA